MTEGFGQRLAALRASRNLSLRELAMQTEVPYNDLLALENGTGRRKPAPDTARRLADYFYTTPDYLLNETAPTAAQLRTGFFRFYDHLSQSERERLKFAPIQVRLDAAVRFLAGAYPTLLNPQQVAARLGYSPEALADVLHGTTTLQSRVLRQLAALVGLDVGFFVRGDFFGGAVEAEQDLSPDRLAAYYQVVQEAIAAGISPGLLRKAVQILSARDQEE